MKPTFFNIKFICVNKLFIKLFYDKKGIFDLVTKMNYVGRVGDLD